MRVFFLDLWLDLREKHLAPVAIALLAAIIAVPIVVSKSSNNDTSTTPATTATTALAPATPVVQSEAEVTSSKLQTFSPRDPFEPTIKVSTTSSSTTSSSTTTSSGSGSSTTSGSSTSGSTGSSGSGGGATTGTQPSTGNSGSGSTGNTTGETKTTLFTYTVDLRFGEGGSQPLYKNVTRLDLIPDQKTPKIVFLGVTTSGKTAVFLVDSNIGVDTAGGKCRPSADECTFLYLRPDSDHNEAVLTDQDGTVYHLRLLAIHRVSVSSSNGSTTVNSTPTGGKKRSNAFTGSADKSSSDTTGTSGDTPPGEPDNSSKFQQFFADSGSGSGK